MHYTFLFPSFLCLIVSVVFLFFFLSHLISLSWHLKILFLLKTRFVVVPLHLLFPLILFGSMIRRHVMTALRTFMTGRFIRNARSFCLISQALLYPVLLALGDELLFVRNPRGVLACSYRSFTPICTPSIPLYLSLLRYSVVHVL